MKPTKCFVQDLLFYNFLFLSEGGWMMMEENVFMKDFINKMKSCLGCYALLD
jgi:hypothetical protein